MVSTSHDGLGKIVGYIEWRQVGPSGFDKPFGEYVWIHDFWIHEPERGQGYVFAELVNDVLEKSTGAKFAYFRRGKYNGRVSKVYTREHFERLVRKRGHQWAAIPL